MLEKLDLRPKILNLQLTSRLKVRYFFNFQRYAATPKLNCVASVSRAHVCLIFLELPVSIVRPLRDRTALENHRVILECTMSTPRCDVAWYKDGEELAPSERLHMLVDGCCHKLIIQQVAAEDEGLYSIEVGEHICQAKLMVEGKMSFMGIIDVFSSYSVT